MEKSLVLVFLNIIVSLWFAKRAARLPTQTASPLYLPLTSSQTWTVLSGVSTSCHHSPSSSPSSVGLSFKLTLFPVPPFCPSLPPLSFSESSPLSSAHHTQHNRIFRQHVRVLLSSVAFVANSLFYSIIVSSSGLLYACSPRSPRRHGPIERCPKAVV